jgi:hypothetical protein
MMTITIPDEFFKNGAWVSIGIDWENRCAAEVHYDRDQLNHCRGDTFQAAVDSAIEDSRSRLPQ